MPRSTVFREPSLRGAQLAGAAILAVATVLAGWTVYLAVAPDLDPRRWKWVVLDTVETMGLFATGVALWLRRTRLAAAAALVTLPLFLLDALLDVTTNHITAPGLIEASLMAALAEIPTVGVLAWIAWRWRPRLRTPAGPGNPQPDPAAARGAGADAENDAGADARTDPGARPPIAG